MTAGKLGGGYRTPGLIMRIRDESLRAVRLAQAAGYNVYNSTVQTAMANLARAVALTLESIGVYTLAPSGDPKVMLESNEKALNNLRLELSRTIADSMKARITRDIRRLERETEKLKKQLSEK